MTPVLCAQRSPGGVRSFSGLSLAAAAFAIVLNAPLAAQEGRPEMRRAPQALPPEPPRARPRESFPVMMKVPYAGMRTEEAPEALCHHLPIPRGFGLLVAEVLKDSPAEHAGIQRHDILLRSDDQRLANPAQMHALIRSRKPGETMNFTVFRAGKEWEVRLTLWETEEPEGRLGERPGVLPEQGGPLSGQRGERVRRVERPEIDLSQSAVFARELLEKTERLGDEAMRKFRELEPFQFLSPPSQPGGQASPAKERGN